jgi:hypothetical protein
MAVAHKGYRGVGLRGASTHGDDRHGVENGVGGSARNRDDRRPKNRQPDDCGNGGADLKSAPSTLTDY